MDPFIEDLKLTSNGLFSINDYFEIVHSQLPTDFKENENIVINIYDQVYDAYSSVQPYKDKNLLFSFKKGMQIVI